VPWEKRRGPLRGEGVYTPPPELTSPPLRYGENLLRASRANIRLHIAEHSSGGV